MAAIFANDTTNTLDQVAEQIKAQANTANRT
jgi:type III secretion protein F